MHEHFNLEHGADMVTFSKKMLAGGIYHKVLQCKHSPIAAQQPVGEDDIFGKVQGSCRVLTIDCKKKSNDCRL